MQNNSRQNRHHAEHQLVRTSRLSERVSRWGVRHSRQVPARMVRKSDPSQRRLSGNHEAKGKQRKSVSLSCTISKKKTSSSAEVKRVCLKRSWLEVVIPFLCVNWSSWVRDIHEFGGNGRELEGLILCCPPIPFAKCLESDIFKENFDFFGEITGEKCWDLMRSLQMWIVELLSYPKYCLYLIPYSQDLFWPSSFMGQNIIWQLVRRQ